MCDACHNDGLYLKDNTAMFCACAKGQERKRAWMQGCEKAKMETDARREKRQRKLRRYYDYKAEAAGERESGEEG